MITLFDPNTDIDLGTPARDSDVQVTLNIDGRSISVPEGTSVMRAAALLGTTIPKTVRHRQPGSLRLLPHVLGGDRRHARLPGLLHHAGH